MRLRTTWSRPGLTLLLVNETARRRIEAALTAAFADWFRSGEESTTRWLPAALARVALDVAVPLIEVELLQEHEENEHW